jgi:hypothetical protein
MLQRCSESYISTPLKPCETGADYREFVLGGSSHRRQSVRNDHGDIRRRLSSSGAIELSIRVHAAVGHSTGEQLSRCTHVVFPLLVEKRNFADGYYP